MRFFDLKYFHGANPPPARYQKPLSPLGGGETWAGNEVLVKLLSLSDTVAIWVRTVTVTK